MNSNKKNRNKDYGFQHKNSRRVKLNSRSDNIFIPGPVPYQANPAPLSSANFVNATTTNHHSSRSRNNAWGNNNNNKTQPQQPPAEPLTSEPPSQSTTEHSSPIKAVEEFPALNANEPKPKLLGKAAQSRKEIEQQSSWLQYDHDDGQDYDALEDYEPTPTNNNTSNSNNNGSRNQSHTSTPHKSHHSLHDLHANDAEINESSQPQQAPPQDTHTPHNRFPTANHSHNPHYNNDDTINKQPYSGGQPRHHQTNYSRPYQSRRSPNAINVDIHSFKRHNNNNNGFNNYDNQHAAVLDGFNGNKRNQGRGNTRANKRRSNKYTVKIRGGSKGREDAQEVHWSNKKRFVPNGAIQNFTPEFKPYRRPSYNAFLQAIKDRDKRDDEQLEQFQRDRKRYAKQHAKQHMDKLQNTKLQNEQKRLKLQQCKEQNALTQLHTQRGRNESRSRHLLQQHMLASQMGLNTAFMQNRMQQSPPGIQPIPQMDVNNLLRNITTNPPSATNTPPIIPFNPNTLLQQNLLSNQLSPNPVPLGTSLSAKTAPWRGAGWTANKHQKMDAQMPQNTGGAVPGGTNILDTGSNTNTSSRGTSPFTNHTMGNNPNTSNAGNVSPFVATNSNMTGTASNQATKSNTVTPQTNPPSLNNMIPSISLTDIRRGSGQGNVTGPASGTVQLQQTLQQQGQQKTPQTTKINLMGFGQAAQTPTQFSQRLYNHHQLLQQQQRHQLLQQAHTQQAMTNIWQQNKPQQDYNQWSTQQPQPGAPGQPGHSVAYAQDFHPQPGQAPPHSYHAQPGAPPTHHHNPNQWNAPNHPQWNQTNASQHNQWGHNQSNWNQYGSYQ
eukprot:216607_1